MNHLIIFIIAIGIGVATVLQGQFVGIMDKNVGTIGSIAITYIGGAIVIGIIFLSQAKQNLQTYLSLPWYVTLSGVFGLVIVGGIGYCVPRLGLVTTLGIALASQFIGAVIFDHFGFGLEPRPLNWIKLLGVVLLLAGSTLITR